MFNSFVVTLLFVWILLYIICFSKLFLKAWVKWWYSLIPFVNIYHYCKIAWKTKYFWVPFYIILAWFFVILTFIFLFNWEAIYDQWLLYKEYAVGMDDFFISHWLFFYQLNAFVPTILFLAFLISFVFSDFVVNISLAKKFKHSVLFWICLAVLNPLFLLILAFDKSKYNKKL